MIILRFRVGLSENKNIDHRGKETCSYQSDQLGLYNKTFKLTLPYTSD